MPQIPIPRQYTILGETEQHAERKEQTWYGFLFHSEDGFTSSVEDKIVNDLRRQYGQELTFEVRRHAYAYGTRRLEVYFNIRPWSWTNYITRQFLVQLRTPNGAVQVDLPRHFDSCIAPFKEMGGCRECPLIGKECYELKLGPLQTKTDVPDLTNPPPVAGFVYTPPKNTTKRIGMDLFRLEHNFYNPEELELERKKAIERGIETRQKNIAFLRESCSGCSLSVNDGERCGVKFCQGALLPIDVIVDRIIDKYSWLLTAHSFTQAEFWALSRVTGTRGHIYRRRKRDTMFSGFMRDSEGRLVANILSPYRGYVIKHDVTDYDEIRLVFPGVLPVAPKGKPVIRRKDRERLAIFLLHLHGYEAYVPRRNREYLQSAQFNTTDAGFLAIREFVTRYGRHVFFNHLVKDLKTLLRDLWPYAPKELVDLCTKE